MRKPVSPHLQIYRVQITSGISALHRITGVILSITSAKVMLGILVAALFPESWALLRPVLTPVTVKISLSVMGCVWLFHSLASLRHLHWDSGEGLEVYEVISSGQWLVMFWAVCSLVFLVLLWRDVLL